MKPIVGKKRPARHPQSRPGTHALTRGVVLLEVLVAILIFMIGVLGVVGMQTAMTQAQTVGKFRADATYLANELVGLLWADLPNLATYNTAACAGNARCSEWSAKVGRSLPGGTSTVVVDAAGVVTIAISWTAPAGVQTYRITSAVAA